MFKLVKKKKQPPVSLKKHHERRHKVLIKRRAGGFGDVVVQRMMFEDFHRELPGMELTFACPSTYLEMAQNHPWVVAVDLGKVDEDDYGVVYDITTACRVHEMRLGPKNRDNRSDIWAAHCGVRLTTHDMHLTALPEHREACVTALKGFNPESKPVVLLATQSTSDNFGVGKSLTTNQVFGVVTELKKAGYYVCTVHGEKQVVYDRLGVDQFVKLKPQSWLALVDCADYVISIDTGTFHIAGGLKKPLVGVFSFTDGKVYGKYYDFILVQKHRDDGWDCGPCFNANVCPKAQEYPKPCLTEITADDILRGFDVALAKWPCVKNGRKTLRRIPLAQTA